MATYLMLRLGGNENPSEVDITKALETVGVEVDTEELTKLLDELQLYELSDLLEKGNASLAKFGGSSVDGKPGNAASEQTAEEPPDPGDDDVDEPVDIGPSLFGDAGDDGDY